MIPTTKTKVLSDRAKLDVNDVSRGGLEKKLNDMQEYLTTAGKGLVSFLVSHIPIVGPAFSTGLDLAMNAGISKVYEKLLRDSNTREERIKNALTASEKSIAASTRQAFNTVALYDEKLGTTVDPDVADCQEAYKEAYRVHLAASCIDELDAAAKMFGKLAEDLAAAAQAYRLRSNIRVSQLEPSIDSFRDNHPNKKCTGLQACYWVPGAGTVFGAIRNDDL